MTGQTYFYIHAVTALNADLIVSIHRVIQKGSDFISIDSTVQWKKQTYLPNIFNMGRLRDWAAMHACMCDEGPQTKGHIKNSSVRT